MAVYQVGPVGASPSRQPIPKNEVTSGRAGCIFSYPIRNARGNNAV